MKQNTESFIEKKEIDVLKDDLMNVKVKDLNTSFDSSDEQDDIKKKRKKS